ncbi:MAG TPA: hypothetical protein VGF48_21805 [Thermoanaerobaculia bacterium]|jgi:hypothetical protein
MIEGFVESSLVIVNLITPKEKFFGVLRALSPAGVTMRAINLDSFDDWIRQIARGEEPNIDLVTMFVPLFRVERIFLDEPSGVIKSYSQRFEDVVGRPVADYLEAGPDAGNGRSV